jgi:hypothetical protein
MKLKFTRKTWYFFLLAAAAVSMQEADLMEQECFRIYDSHAAFIGIFRWSACVFKPVKMFYSHEQPGK